MEQIIAVIDETLDQNQSLFKNLVAIGFGIIVVMLITIFSLTHYATSSAAEKTSQTVLKPDTDFTAYLYTADMRSDFETSPAIAREGVLKRGSTLTKTLVEMGAEPGQAYEAVQSVFDADLMDPRKLRAGLKVLAHFDAASKDLISLSMKPDSERQIFSKRMASTDYIAAELGIALRKTYRRIQTQITSSIYEAALQAGGKDQQVSDFAYIFAYDIDFQRDIFPGDKIEILYEIITDEFGNHIRSGDILYASLSGKRIERAYYRHRSDDTGFSDYFTSEGKAATRFLMKTPINGARLSSKFGKRRHPIYGYTRMHKGTDFAAVTGTPIMAAGNGTVERASRNGGYGKYVRIRHANGYKTAYAHMSRYGAGMKAGTRVKQGDIIGYVGSTGASTGPHLHYEVILNGRHVNAMTLKLPSGRSLQGEHFDNFIKIRNYIDTLREQSNNQEIDVSMLRAL